MRQRMEEVMVGLDQCPDLVAGVIVESDQFGYFLLLLLQELKFKQEATKDFY